MDIENQPNENEERDQSFRFSAYYMKFDAERRVYIVMVADLGPQNIWGLAAVTLSFY